MSSDGRADFILVAGLGLLAYAAYSAFAGGSSDSGTSGDNVTMSGNALDSGTLATLAQEGADQYGLRPELVLGVILKESRGDPGAVGDGGLAIGLMQMHAPAASDVGVNWSDLAGNPELQVLAGSHYLSLQVNRFGDERTALIAYNQGAGVASNPADPRYATGARYADSVLSIAAAQTITQNPAASPSSTILDPSGYL
jgi:soluble lytic murein transglycosylase-like protein